MDIQVDRRPSLEELTEYFDKLETLEIVSQLYSLSALLNTGLFSAAYEIPEAWAEVVVPSEAGKRMLGFAPSAQYKPAELHLALFLMFHHHQLLIDERKTDPDEIRKLVEPALLKKQIRWPYQWGRLLYDKYNDVDGGPAVEELGPAQAEALLKDTPQGIYQIGRELMGPLGILRSDENRYLPFEGVICLWHCSDTGCQAAHNVRLLEPKHRFSSARSQMRGVANEQLGKQQRWPIVFESICLGLAPTLNPNPRKYYNLPTVVAECVQGEELHSLLELALTQATSEQLREKLRLRGNKELCSAPSKEILSRLSTFEQIQLLLVLSDSNLVRLLDSAVWSDRIRVAQSEVRAAKFEQYKVRQGDVSAEMSNLGIRSTQESPLISLASEISKVYSDLKYNDELDWRIHRGNEVSRAYGLASYLRENGPEKAVRDLILCSHPVTKLICDTLLLPLPDLVGSEEAIRKILWKFGFNPPRLNSYQRMSERLDTFRSTLLRIGDVHTEDHRELIRESGVNLFVSVESLLDELVSYPIWLLSSDHFVTTGCTFDLVKARERVADILGESAIAGGMTFRWNKRGENTLGTLLIYLNLTSDWMRGLSRGDPAAYVRSKDDFPHYAETYASVFAFRHTQLWADSDKSELERLAQAYAEIVRLIAQSDPAAVRNAIDHWRDERDFPSIEKMFAFVARFDEAFRLASERRYLPKWHWLQASREDRFGGVEYEFRDYAGSKLILYGPPHVLDIPTIEFTNPVIVAPGNPLGYPNSELVFLVKEPTAYADYWNGYPRRDQEDTESDPKGLD